jgi:hypothetical protein
MNHKRLARRAIGSLILLTLVLPVIGPQDVTGAIHSGFILGGSRYHLDDYCVTYREYSQSASVRWYDPEGHQTNSCPVSGSCLVCHYEYLSGVFLYKDCYFYIRGQNRELGRYTVQAGGSTDYFDIVPYYVYLPLVLR